MTAKTATVQCDLDLARRFFAALYDPEDMVEVRCFSSNGRPVRQRWWKAGDGGIYDWCAQRSAEGYGIFVGANPRKERGGSKNEDIAIFRCFFTDVDDTHDINEVRRRIEEAGLPQPSITTDSGHQGFHLYWLLHVPLTDYAKWQDLEDRVVAAVGGDADSKDAARVLRVPGYPNLKSGGPYATDIVRCDPEWRHDLDGFQRLPSVNQGEEEAETPEDDKPIKEGHRHNYLKGEAGRLRYLRFSGDALLGALRGINAARCKPPLPDKEVVRLAKDFGKKVPGTKRQPVSHEAEVVRVSYDEMRRVRWLVRDHFPLGKLSIIAGMPGSTKSLFSIYLIAAMQGKTTLPDLAHNIKATVIPGDALLVTCEDDPKDTIAPRLAAYEVDPYTVPIVRGTKTTMSDGTEAVSLIDLNKHLDAVEDLLRKNARTRLIVIDPVQTFLGDTELNGNAQVNQSLTRLTTLGQRHDAAVILIMHHNKKLEGSAMDRVIGSRGFSGTARAMWSVTQDVDNRDRHIMACVKLQNARKPLAMANVIDTRPVRIEGEDELVPYLEFELERFDANGDWV